MCRFGYDSPERVKYWIDRLRGAAIQSMTPERQIRETLAATLNAVYRAKIERGAILRYHLGIERFTLERIRPRLRAELDRRILAAAALIKVNRAEAVETTLRRFGGWATSSPPGGSDAVDRRAVKTEIKKPLASLPFRERRVAIDQGHKFVSNLSDIIATEAGAIAGVWHSNWRQRNYDYREDHKERDEHVYLVRDSWAHQAGFVKANDNGYVDQITRPGEEVFCRCRYSWIYSLRKMPPDLLTEKGRHKLDETRLAA